MEDLLKVNQKSTSVFSGNVLLSYLLENLVLFIANLLMILLFRFRSTMNCRFMTLLLMNISQTFSSENPDSILLSTFGSGSPPHALTLDTFKYIIFGYKFLNSVYLAITSLLFSIIIF